MTGRAAMHEVGAVKAAAQRLIEDVAGEPVAAVTVRLGPDVSVDVAASAWQAAVAGSPVAAARVHWRRAYHLLRCPQCEGDYFGPASALCPGCASTGTLIAETPLVAVTGWSA